MKEESREVSYQEFKEGVEELQRQVRSGGFSNFDFVVAIARGGLTLGVEFSHSFDVPLGILRVQSYSNRTKDEVEISGQMAPVFDSGADILIVDDICDTGQTLEYVQEMVEWWCDGEVRTAVIHVRPESSDRPDYFVEETDEWIVYPWEQ